MVSPVGPPPTTTTGQVPCWEGESLEGLEGVGVEEKAARGIHRQDPGRRVARLPALPLPTRRANERAARRMAAMLKSFFFYIFN